MFFAIIWLLVAIAGGVVEGSIRVATTVLTRNLSYDATTLYVKSTSGFSNSGIIVIDTERIAYSSKSATTFYGSFTAPLIRGSGNTTKAAHLINDRVRTLESSMMNQSAQYNTSLVSDVSGPLAFVTVPLAVFRILGSYLLPQMQFLGTDLQILVYFWWAMLAGMIITIGISLAGSRRV
jgi:hypothetical protein